MRLKITKIQQMAIQQITRLVNEIDSILLDHNEGMGELPPLRPR